MSLQIDSQEREAGYFEFSLEGQLDTMTYRQLEQALAIRLESPVKAIALDMAKLDYISSMGLRVIFKAMKELKERKAAFMMTNLQPQVKRIFEIANAVPESSVFKSIDEADAYYRMVQEKVKRGESI